MVAESLDAHAKPPTAIRDVYKRYQKSSVKMIDQEAGIIDTRTLGQDGRLSLARADGFAQLPAELKTIFASFAGQVSHPSGESKPYSVKGIPGLYVYPNVLPQEVQLHFLSLLFNRDLSNPEHQTNVHMHYQVPYPNAGFDHPASYFAPAASGLNFSPKDPEVHKPLTTLQYLTKKLRWMTLGGQYDWTQKVYPQGPPPPFPADIKNLIESLFPIKVEAAIVNLYSPGDTLSLHRDVSEECNQPLVSLSLGCDGIFVIGLDEVDGSGKPKVATIRLRSGDAVLMSGESRYAWHSVPKIVENTCPDWMQDWPGDEFEAWRGWMSRKRINLNVRQMFD